MEEFNKNNKIEGFGRAGIILILPFIILVLAFLVYKLFLMPDPAVTGIEALQLLSADKSVTLQGENIKSISINIYQDGNTIELLSDTPDHTERTYKLEIKPRELKLKDGPAVIVIEATAGFLKEISYELSSMIDTVPPTLEVLRAPSIINRGSAGFAVLKAKGADSVHIKLGERTFKAFEAVTAEGEQSGSFQMPDAGLQEEAGKSRKTYMSTYYVFFPAPFDIEEGSVFYAIAVDVAGNRKVKALPTQLKMKDYKASSITIDDAFINTKIASLLNVTEVTDPEGAFRKVNEEWRRESLEKIIDISRTTEAKVMWEGRFMQMRNSKVMATYGDQREYLYKGKAISKSVHLGYDLASFSNAPVEAANAGIIRYAGDLSIFGEAVIIDHGLGLMSIYGHLSEIVVGEGEEVKKGDIIGKTGSSGLAGGDHLHFGILVHGYEVSPLYWWDPNWIRIHITDHLSY